MQIKVWFSNDQCIDIELFDNPTVAKWFARYQQISSADLYSSTLFNLLEHKTTRSNEKIQEQWNILLGAFSKLSGMGFCVPFQVEPNFDYQQSTLNFLHRFFTYNAAWYRNNKNDPTILNYYDSSFKLPDELSFIEWHKIIEDINDPIHQIECYANLTENKKFIIDNLPLDVIYTFLSTRQHSDFSPWLPFTEEDQQLNYNYFDYDLPLVILDWAILGKCVLQSFAEDDDLNATDCTGRLGSFGGFFIDLNDNRKKIYQSDQFKKWIAKNNRDFASLPLEFPIGYVKNYQDVLQWISKNLKFKKIEFID